MRARILSGLLGGAIGLAPVLVSAQPLTLGEAVRQALAQDDAVAAASVDREAAGIGIHVARHAYRPRLDALEAGINSLSTSWT